MTTPPPDWSRLPTESRHPDSAELDTFASVEVVDLLLADQARGIEQARAQGAAIARVADWVAETLAAGGDVVFLGAGTSGRLGFLEAAECPPTFGTDPDRIRSVMAGGRDAVFAAREGAEDRAEDGAAAAGGLVSSDLLIAISASSVTPFVRGALDAARTRGVRSVLLTCAAAQSVPKTSEGGELASQLIALSTGPEVLTGSTRLKAGSATKAVLNAITTTAMVRLGKVFENLMVDLRQGSAKLRDRAVRIVAAAGRVEREEAERLLDSSAGEVKTAIVAARLAIPPPAARRRLEAARGAVRPALTGE